MTLDELDATFVLEPQTPYGCMRHHAYWEHRCKRGTLGCGVYHKEVEKVEVNHDIRTYNRARQAIEERTVMALAGKCYHCDGKVTELHSVVRMPGIRYFVCEKNKAHTVIYIPKEVAE